MKIGFTGTRKPLNDLQKESLWKVLNTYSEIESYHHGDCLGADAEFHYQVWTRALIIAQNSKCSTKIATIVIHPPIDPKEQAFCYDKYSVYAFKTSLEVREPKTYLARNRDIVDETDLLIGIPPTFEAKDALRSGTWYTIRYAMKKDKSTISILPDGTTRQNLF